MRYLITTGGSGNHIKKKGSDMKAFKWLIVILLLVAFSNVDAASPKNKIRYNIGGGQK